MVGDPRGGSALIAFDITSMTLLSIPFFSLTISVNHVYHREGKTNKYRKDAKKSKINK
jgi:predicted glycosyltransferase involved in capsule biosynthesis